MLVPERPFRATAGLSASMNNATSETAAALTRRAALAGLAAGAALGAPAVLRAAPPRIVTVGGGVTETVFALGRGRDVVATDAASLYPRVAAGTPKLAYAKGLDAESLLARRPDIVLVADEAGPRAALDEIAASGVRYLRLPEARAMADLPSGVRSIAQAIGEPARGEVLADAMAADLAAVAEGLRGVATRRRALVLLGRPDARMLLTAGRGSPAGLALGLAGADNAAERISGWSWISPADAEGLDPEVVVALASEPMSPERVLAAPAVRDTPAGREGRVAVVDAQAFTGFGPRAAHAIHAAASRIYPEARLAPLPARRWGEIETAAL